MEDIYAKFKNHLSNFVGKIQAGKVTQKKLRKVTKKYNFFKPLPEAKLPAPRGRHTFMNKFQRASVSATIRQDSAKIGR
jgi:hypothetical protein